MFWTELHIFFTDYNASGNCNLCHYQIIKKYYVGWCQDWFFSADLKSVVERTWTIGNDMQVDGSATPNAACSPAPGAEEKTAKPVR